MTRTCVLLFKNTMIIWHLILTSKNVFQYYFDIELLEQKKFQMKEVIFIILILQYYH